MYLLLDKYFVLQYLTQRHRIDMAEEVVKADCGLVSSPVVVCYLVRSDRQYQRYDELSLSHSLPPPALLLPAPVRHHTPRCFLQKKRLEMFSGGAEGGGGVAKSEEEIYELPTSHSCSLCLLPSHHSNINISQLWQTTPGSQS